MKTRLTLMDVAEAERISEGGVGQDAPSHANGICGRAPSQGVKDSDIPTQLRGETHFKGQREWAPAQGAKDSDISALS